MKSSVVPLEKWWKYADERRDSSSGNGESGASWESKMNITPASLHELIQTRKAEAKKEAEDIRNKDLLRIEDMWSRVGVNPLELFPREIWAMIISGLSPQDKDNLWQVHEFFRDMMKSTRIRDILFPLIVDAEVNLYPDGLFSKYGLDFQDLRSLGQVSKAMRESASCVIESRILKDASVGMLRPLFVIKHQLLIHMPFRGSDSEMKAMKKRFQAFAEVNGPKILFSRSLLVLISLPMENVRFEAREEHYQRQLWTSVSLITEFLRLVGDQILHLHLCTLPMELLLVDRGLSALQIYDILKGWLELMPNLKWLQLSIVGLGTPGWDISGARLHILNNPMPMLKELVRVDFLFPEAKDNASDGFFIWDAILNANPHVKVHNFHHNHVQSVERYLEPLVQSLELDLLNSGKFPWQCHAVMDVPLLRRISYSWNSWKLQIACLQIDLKDGGIGPVLRCLKWFPALRTLNLQIDNVRFDAGEINFLQLPNLKRFFLRLGPKLAFSGSEQEIEFFYSALFLLHCPKMEHMDWKYLQDNAVSLRRQLESGSQVLDFKGGLVDLSGSNVWDVFPKLQTIWVSFQEKLEVNGCDEELQFYSRLYCRRELVQETIRSGSGVST